MALVLLCKHLKSFSGLCVMKVLSLGLTLKNILACVHAQLPHHGEKYNVSPLFTAVWSVVGASRAQLWRQMAQQTPGGVVTSNSELLINNLFQFNFILFYLQGNVTGLLWQNWWIRHSYFINNKSMRLCLQCHWHGTNMLRAKKKSKKQTNKKQ